VCRRPAVSDDDVGRGALAAATRRKQLPRDRRRISADERDARRRSRGCSLRGRAAARMKIPGPHACGIPKSSKQKSGADPRSVYDAVAAAKARRRRRHRGYRGTLHTNQIFMGRTREDEAHGREVIPGRRMMFCWFLTPLTANGLAQAAANSLPRWRHRNHSDEA